MNRKNVLRWLMNIVFLYLAMNVVINLYRQYQAGEELAGRDVSQMVFKDLDGKTHRLRDKAGPKVLAFWATWCGPCTIELSRLDDLVKEKKVPRENIFPISIGEEQQVVVSASRERNYTMNVYWDEQSDTQNFVPVVATPTMVYVDRNHKITEVDTGINPLLSQKVLRFFEGTL